MSKLIISKSHANRLLHNLAIKQPEILEYTIISGKIIKRNE